MPCLLFFDIHKTKTQHTFPKLGSRNSRASSSSAPPFSSCQQWSGPKKGWEHHHTGKSGWWQGTAGMSFLSHVLSKVHQSFSVLFSQPANFAWVAIISFTSLELLPFYQPNQTVWRQTSKIKTEGCVSLKLLHSQAAKVRGELWNGEYTCRHISGQRTRFKTHKEHATAKSKQSDVKLHERL